MAYDPNKDYAKEINDAIASGASKETVAALNDERNEKIAANQEHYNAKGIGPDDVHGTAAQQYVSGASQTPQASAQVPAAQVPASAAPQSADSAALSRQAAESVRNSRMSRADTGTFRGYLDDWLKSASEGSGERIDRGVTQGVNELARAQEESEERFQTQRNQIDADERRALDNRALYDAMRGDRGGIAGEQYSSIMNAAMQNRVAVNTAQTKLANDTLRQIAELRAQGKFQKSQELIQLNQQYLSQLMSLEQWAMEYNASADQFNASLDQWLASYNAQLRQMDLSQYQWEQSFAYQKQTDERNYNRSVFESDRAFDYQRGVDQRNFDYQKATDERNYNRAVLESDRAFDANRSDAAWQRGITERQIANDEADAEWRRGMTERQYADSRADTRWQQGMTERQYADSRADTGWQQGMTERQYADNRSDTAWSQGMTEQQFAASQRANLQQYVMAALSSGYMVDDATLKEAGIDKNYAEMVVSNARNVAALEAEKSAADIANKNADTANKTASALKSAAELNGTGGGKKPSLTAEQVQEALSVDHILSPSVLSAYEYYYGESYFQKHPSAYPVESVNSRKDAVSALELMGLGAAASGLMNSSQWNSRKVKWMKDKTIDDPSVSGYDSYIEYVRAYIQAMRGDNEGEEEVA